MQGDGNFFGVAGQCLVDTVIDHLMDEMVGARSVRVHTRTATNRIEAGEDLKVLGGVGGAHGGARVLEIRGDDRAVRNADAGADRIVSLCR